MLIYNQSHIRAANRRPVDDKHHIDLDIVEFAINENLPIRAQWFKLIIYFHLTAFIADELNSMMAIDSKRSLS